MIMKKLIILLALIMSSFMTLYSQVSELDSNTSLFDEKGKKIEVLSGEELVKQLYTFGYNNERKNNNTDAIKYYQNALDVLLNHDWYENQYLMKIINAIENIEKKEGNQIIFKKSNNTKKYCYAYFYAATVNRNDPYKCIYYFLHAKESNQVLNP